MVRASRSTPRLDRPASLALGKRLGRPKFSDGDELVLALETGDSWHTVSKVTKIPYSTVKKDARVRGYEPKRRGTSAAESK